MCKHAFKLLLIPFLLFYALPISAAEKEEKTWQDEIVYFIVVDRFNNGNPKNDGEDVDPKNPTAYNGGDIEGIIKKLDYLQDMGFTSIVLSSIFANEAGGYAGELIADHTKVDEHFGSIEDVKRLVNEAHKRDINVMLEYVAGHVGPNHPWLKDENKQEWFHQKTELTNVEDVENRVKGWYNGLPDLSTENPETRAYLIDTAKWWLKETNIDGYYINNADTVETDFWKVFQSELEKDKNIFLIGTLLDHREETLTAYQEAGFDSLLNQRFYEVASETFSGVDHPFESVSKVVEQSLNTQSTFVDSDNTLRFTRKAVENQQHPGIRLKMAFSYMYMIPGTPIVYYGTEIAVDGGEPPENRPLMNFQSDEELIDYLEKLAKIRKSFPALTKGDYQVLYEKDGMIIFKRTYESETIVIAINNTSASQKVQIPAEEIEANKQLSGLVTGNTFQEENGEYEFIIDRELAEVYEIKEKTGLNLPFISVFILVPALFILFLIAANKRGKKNK